MSAEVTGKAVEVVTRYSHQYYDLAKGGWYCVRSFVALRHPEPRSMPRWKKLAYIVVGVVVFALTLGFGVGFAQATEHILGNISKPLALLERSLTLQSVDDYVNDEYPRPNKTDATLFISPKELCGNGRFDPRVEECDESGLPVHERTGTCTDRCQKAPHVECPWQRYPHNCTRQGQWKVEKTFISPIILGIGFGVLVGLFILIAKLFLWIYRTRIVIDDKSNRMNRGPVLLTSYRELDLEQQQHNEFANNENGNVANNPEEIQMAPTEIVAVPEVLEREPLMQESQSVTVDMSDREHQSQTSSDMTHML